MVPLSPTEGCWGPGTECLAQKRESKGVPAPLGQGRDRGLLQSFLAGDRGTSYPLPRLALTGSVQIPVGVVALNAQLEEAVAAGGALVEIGLGH